MTERGSDVEWLKELLNEVGLPQFLSKLTDDLQLTKLSHFDFVKEEDLLEIGISRPAAKRLLASVRKQKSFVSAVKSKIFNKLLPSANSSAGSTKNRNEELTFVDMSGENSNNILEQTTSEFGRLTCLINSQDIQIKEEIGHGVHGFVKKGEWTTPNGRVVEVALKILRKDVMSEPGATFNDFVKEISVMHQLNHSNIIKLYGVVLSSPMMMVTELAPFGNLRDRLRKENGQTPISQLINFGVQIVSGMRYLESKRFIHRDLAARNIFISHGKKILIGDLGLMRAVPSQEDHYVMSERTKIPYPWCAPESLKFKQFSSSSDVYMFGVTLWEMFSFGREPWANLNLNEILDNISSHNKRLPCPEACPAMVYQTLLQCWNTEPSRRPNFSNLYQYLSTSYPLEVRSTQNISELGQTRQNGVLMPNDLTDSSSSSSSASINDEQDLKQRKVLTCLLDDRIQVIDGQPEKYWWKGQNQRTFEIGWFPLCSTRWLAKQKSQNYISKPLKNSFVHTGHCGPHGKWGSPRFIDHMYLKNPLQPADIDAFSTSRLSSQFKSQDGRVKSKPKSKLSRLFGLTESHSNNTHLLPHSYQKFSNEPSQHLKTGDLNRRTLVRSQSNGISGEKVDDGPPLIDFSDDNSTQLANNFTTVQTAIHQESLIDIDTQFPNISEFPLQRRSSDTRLDQRDDVGNYRLSWAGSWNTGTFDGSSNDIYSAYYCPQDAAAAIITTEADPNRYYSAVTNEQ